MEDGPDILNLLNVVTLFKISSFLITVVIGIPLFLILLSLITVKVGIQTINEDYIKKD